MSSARHTRHPGDADRWRWIRVLAFAAAAVGVLTGALVAREQSAERAAVFASLRKAVPAPTVPNYVTSDRCQACHPSQHDSWHRTYHRTMTQLPSEASVVGDFDDHRVDLSTGSYRFFRRGDEFRIEVPEWWVIQAGRMLDIPTPSTDQQVVLLTGSHHQQVYWLGLEDQILSAGVNWVKDFNRFVPLDDVFLKPAENQRLRGLQKWTSVCVRCHSTPAWRVYPITGKTDEARTSQKATRGPAPLRPMPPLTLTEPLLESTASVLSVKSAMMPELGISCEACHGPAEEHIELYSSPIRRYAQHLKLGDADTHILNPEKMSAEESSRLCGSCHAPRAAFRIGLHPEVREASMRDPKLVWPDGMVRSGGRGYVAVTQSPCFAGGDFGCNSCHSMHDAPPSDQLSAGMDGNEACVQCHSTLATQSELEEHTHHTSESGGSLCYNCHMPHTAFNLLKATRSHQIDSPNVAAHLDTGRPNACNLCHLDRSLGWTSDHLSEWYGQPKVELNGKQRLISAAALGALEGDAMQRALYGWSMGWGPALEASGRSWFVPMLAVLLDDPYAAVRVVATRSLKTVPQWGDFSLDPWDPPGVLSEDGAEGERARKKIVARWMKDGPALERSGRGLLLRKNGKPNWQSIDALLAERDQTRVRSSE